MSSRDMNEDIIPPGTSPPSSSQFGNIGNNRIDREIGYKRYKDDIRDGGIVSSKYNDPSSIMNEDNRSYYGHSKRNMESFLLEKRDADRKKNGERADYYLHDDRGNEKEEGTGWETTKKKKRKKKHKHHHRSSSTSSSSSSIPSTPTSSSESSRERSRSRSKSHHRSHKSKRRHRSKSRSQNSSDNEYYGDRWKIRNEKNESLQIPTTTIMMRNMPTYFAENDIATNISDCGIPFKDIRLIRHRDTGVSRGFAFVEFMDATDAKRYMDAKNGVAIFLDQFEVSLSYANSRSSDRQITTATDWFCSKCTAHNFKRRLVCYRCNASKEEDGMSIPFGMETNKFATTTLLLKNLDTLSTEDSIMQAIQSRADLSAIPVKSIKVSREALTNLSRGFCYLETNDISDAVRFYDCHMENPFKVDDRILYVTYSKPLAPHSAVVNTAAAAALAAAQWTSVSSTNLSTAESEIQRQAEYSANLYAKTPAEKASYLEYYLEYYRNQSKQGGLMQQNSASTSVSEPNRAVSPLMSRLQFDQTSGYYYDPITFLYYDATSQSFYDSATKKHLQWDGQKREYIELEASKPAQFGELDKKEIKVKASMSVVKDALKQATTFNTIKHTSEVPSTKSSNNGITDRSNISGKFPGMSISKSNVGKSSTLSLQNLPRDTKSSRHNVTPKGVFVVDTAVESDDSDNESKGVTSSGAMISDTWTDLEKLACKLCKRQFSTMDTLVKHIEMSSLHQTNLAKFAASKKVGSDRLSSSNFSKKRFI